MSVPDEPGRDGTSGVDESGRAARARDPVIDGI
jgi:hypothetical protein